MKEALCFAPDKITPVLVYIFDGTKNESNELYFILFKDVVSARLCKQQSDLKQENERFTGLKIRHAMPKKVEITYV